MEYSQMSMSHPYVQSFFTASLFHKAQKAHMMMHSEYSKLEFFSKFFVRKENLVEKWAKNYMINILQKLF